MDEANENSSSLQAMRLLVHDAVDAMKNNDTSRVLVYLNLVEQQLGVQQSKNETLIAGFNTTTNAAAATTFLTYKHPTAGIKIQYPNNWSFIDCTITIQLVTTPSWVFILLQRQHHSLGIYPGYLGISFRMWIYIISIRRINHSTK